MIENLSKVAKIFSYIDQSIGKKNFIFYSVTVLLFSFLIIYRANIVDSIFGYIENIQAERHSAKLEKRDELLFELGPILREFRAETGADRILYFEYHNSKENLVKIPFKYIDLVSMYTRYNVPGIENFKDYHDIGSGIMSDLYHDLGNRDVICSDEPEFSVKYQNEKNFFMKDGAKKQCYVNLSGINTPIGFIILEWLEDEAVTINTVNLHMISIKYASRINALIIKNVGFDFDN